MLSDSNKLIFNNTMLLYTRLAITMVIGFLTTRIVLEQLGASDYGIYFVVGGIVALFSLLNGSMSGATQRWITISLGKGNQDYLNEVFTVGMTAQLGIVFIAVGLYESLGIWYLNHYAVFPEERMETIFWVFQFSVITAIIQLLSAPFIGAITAHEKMSALVYVAFIDIIVKVVICILLPFVSLDKLLFYAGVILLGQVLQIGFYVHYCSKQFEEARFSFGWNYIIFKDMWRIAFWSLSGNLAFISYTQGIVLLINFYFGPTVNAAAGVASQAANIVNQFRTNFQEAMKPQIMKNFAKRNLLDMEKLVIRSSKFSQYLVVIFSVPLFLEAPFLLDLWLKDVPVYAVEFLRASLFVSMAMTVREPLVTASLASGDLKRYVIVVTLILMFILPFTYFAYSLGASPETGSWITFAVICVAIFASAYMLQSMTGLGFVRFIKGAMIPILLVTLLSFAAPLIIQQLFEEGWLRVILVGFVSLVSSLGVIYLLGLEEREKNFFKNKSIDIFKRIRSVK